MLATEVDVNGESFPGRCSAFAQCRCERNARCWQSCLNLLLTVHSGVAFCFGLCAFFLPHIFGFFLGEEWHGSWRWNPDDGQVKITHVVIRLYGALIFGQGILTWAAKETDDGQVRRWVVRAYAVVFSLTTVALLRAQFTDSTWHALNWLNILLFAALAAFYSWFSMIVTDSAWHCTVLHLCNLRQSSRVLEKSAAEGHPWPATGH
eukprot:s18_g14.t1